MEQLGEEVARKLKSRVAELRAAAHATDLPVGHPRPITYQGWPAMVVNFGSEHQLIFVSRHEKRGAVEAVSVDWSKVFDVKIVKIGKEYE